MKKKNVNIVGMIYQIVNVTVYPIHGEMTMGTIKEIKNKKIYGLDFYYDEELNKIGFPTFYNENTNVLDYRVGHQFWVDIKQAKAIVLRLLELQNKIDEDSHNSVDK